MKNKNNKVKIILSLGLTLVAIFIFALKSLNIEKTNTLPVQNELPERVKIGGAFELVDHKGEIATEKSWPDQHRLVFFGFTNCMMVCPTGLQNMTNILDALDDQTRSKIQALFITTDPERDDVKRMASYLEAFHETIIGLTGTTEQIKAVIDVYRVYAVKVISADDYQMDHSAYLYLMSPDDEMIKMMRVNDNEEEIVAILKKYLS